MEIGLEFTIGRALASWLQFDVVGSNWVEGAGTEPICPGWTSRECELDGVIAGMEGGCEGLERSPTSLQDSLYRTASGKIPRGPCTDNAWWPEKLRPGGRKTNESSSAATVERARVQVRQWYFLLQTGRNYLSHGTQGSAVALFSTVEWCHWIICQPTPNLPHFQYAQLRVTDLNLFPRRVALNQTTNPTEGCPWCPVLFNIHAVSVPNRNPHLNSPLVRLEGSLR